MPPRATTTHPLQHWRAGLSTRAPSCLFPRPSDFGGAHLVATTSYPKFDLFSFLSSNQLQLPNSGLDGLPFSFPPDNEYRCSERGAAATFGRRRWLGTLFIREEFLPPGKVGACFAAGVPGRGEQFFLSFLMYFVPRFYFLICQDMEYIPFSLFTTTRAAAATTVFLLLLLFIFWTKTLEEGGRGGDLFYRPFWWPLLLIVFFSSYFLPSK